MDFQMWSTCFTETSFLRISLHSCTSPIATLCLLFHRSEAWTSKIGIHQYTHLAFADTHMYFYLCEDCPHCNPKRPN